MYGSRYNIKYMIYEEMTKKDLVTSIAKKHGGVSLGLFKLMLSWDKEKLIEIAETQPEEIKVNHKYLEGRNNIIDLT